MTHFFNEMLRFVMVMSARYNIDESHSLGHSLTVLNYTNQIFESERYIFPPLKKQEKVVYSAAVLHDMCDKKYVDEEEGKRNIDELLTKLKMPNVERRAVIDIIDTMSYSKVKTTGFPYHGEYQRAYHVVREADLLAAYDFDRCMLYRLHQQQHGDLEDAIEDSENLFNKRVFKHKSDGLLTTRFANDQHDILAMQASNQIQSWKKMLNTVKRIPK